MLEDKYRGIEANLFADSIEKIEVLRKEAFRI